MWKKHSKGDMESVGSSTALLWATHNASEFSVLTSGAWPLSLAPLNHHSSLTPITCHHSHHQARLPDLCCVILGLPMATMGVLVVMEILVHEIGHLRMEQCSVCNSPLKWRRVILFKGGVHQTLTFSVISTLLNGKNLLSSPFLLLVYRLFLEVEHLQTDLSPYYTR